MARSPCPLDFSFAYRRLSAMHSEVGGVAPPRSEKIEQKRARELTKVIQLSPNTAAGGFRAQTRRASFAGRPPTPRRRFWRAPAPRLNLRGGMVVQIRARQTRRRTAGSPCSQRRKAKRQSAQAGRRVRRGRDRRRTLRARRTETRPPAAVTRRARN